MQGCSADMDENLFLFHAFLLGIYITFVYDLLRIIRRVIPHKNFVVSLEDLGFWGFCAVEVFLLMYRESNGSLRWFAVFGALVGMLLYRKSISNLFVKYVSFLLQKLLKIIGRIGHILGKPFVAAGRGIGHMKKRIRERRKRILFFCKKRLTTFIKMLRMSVKKR